jgi:small subunit ribosomal protein S3
VAQGAASEIERRIPFRRVMKQAIDRVINAGAKGVKINMAGRLNGVDIARSEVLSAGKMSLITLRSDVDYALLRLILFMVKLVLRFGFIKAKHLRIMINLLKQKKIINNQSQ